MHIIDNSWKRIHLLHSAETTRKLLTTCYKKLKINDAEMKGYDNCYSFIYYLEQGEVFYKQAKIAPINIKPLLLFYGLIHLIKACLLTVDPDYPSTTSVLAHGVSTRKRKKRQYKFLHDEIRIQKNGLCSYFAEQLFHVKQLDGEKLKMGDLLYLIAEMDDTFHYLMGESNMFSLVKEKDDNYRIPLKIAEAYYMDQKRLIDYLNKKSLEKIRWTNEEELIIPQTTSAPFRYHIVKKEICLPGKLHQYTFLPDLMIHYLILYNLSMISRYETEWWMELIKTTPNSDLPMIKAFLEITESKGPFLIDQLLVQRLNNVGEQTSD